MRTIKLGLALATTLGLLATAAPATAAPADTVDGLKAAVSARIDQRLAALTKDSATVTNSQVLTDAHRGQLATVLSESTSGLTALKAKVAMETTVAALREDATSMVNDYRVFLLVGPQVRLTTAGDYADKAVARAGQAYDKLAASVAEKKAGGADTSAAEADLAQMQAAIASAQGHLDGRVAALLALEPGPDGTAIRAGVSTARSAIGSARADLLTAAAKGRAVLAFLRTA